MGANVIDVVADIWAFCDLTVRHRGWFRLGRTFVCRRQTRQIKTGYIITTFLNPNYRLTPRR
jgi:hypothetical protein